MELVKPDWGLMIFMFIPLCISICVGVLFLLNLQGTLSRCAPETRRMQPGLVWLILIPVFGIVWLFIVVNRIADSLAAEFRRRQLPLNTQRPGYIVGLLMCIAACGSVLLVIGKSAEIRALHSIGFVFAFVTFVLMIVYWAQISGYKKQLIRSGLYAQYYNHQNQHQYHGNYYQQGHGTSYGQYNQPPQYNWQHNPQTPPPSNANNHSHWGPPGSN